MDPSTQAPFTGPTEPTTPVVGSAPTGHKGGKNKRLAIILAAVAVVVIMATVAVILLLNLGPSREDYQKAQALLKEAGRSYTTSAQELRSFMTSVGYGDTDVTPDNARKAFTEYKEQTAKFKDEHAIVLKDEEVQKAYDAFEAKNKEFVAFIDTFIDSSDVLLQVSEDCSADKAQAIYADSDMSTISERYAKVLGPCMASIEKMTESSNKILAEFAHTLGGLYEEQQGLFAKLQAAYKAKDQTEYSNVIRQISEQGKKFSHDVVAELRDEMDEVDANDELNALGRLLTDKANNS